MEKITLIFLSKKLSSVSEFTKKKKSFLNSKIIGIIGRA